MEQEVLWKGIDTSKVSEVKLFMQVQASYLGKITNNVVEAKVTTNLNMDDFTVTVGDKITVTYFFEILAPLLDYKSFTLFSVVQTIGAEFPLTIRSFYTKLPEQMCATIDDFKRHLQDFFSSPEILGLINSIIATSK